MKVGTLSESLEDYLEIIFRLLLSNKVARVRDIARAKDVKTSSVTSAMQRLAKEGLVDYQAREYVDLTDKGRELAFRLNQRHDFLKKFFVEFLQVDPEVAEEDACSVEHSISIDTLDRLTSFSEFMTYCPKVDINLITDFRDYWLAQSELDRGDFVQEYGLWQKKEELIEKFGVCSLTDLKPGEGGVVARIVANPDDRKKMIQSGFLPASRIKVLQKQNGKIQVDLSGIEKELTAKEAKSVYVWADQETLDKVISNVELQDQLLADLDPGKRFRIKKVVAKGEIRQRLIDMGFIKGAEGKLIREALLRDPIELEMEGYFLSLRRAEARDIIVEEING